MRKINLYIMLVFILTACASPAPTAAPTATVTPSLTMTAAPTATATVTPTSTPTAIPATPEYAGELRYDPETRALNNPQGTPIFTLSEDGAWKGLTPEVPGEIMAGLEEEGYSHIEIEDKHGTQIITGEDKNGDGKRDILGVFTGEYKWDVEGISEDLGLFGESIIGFEEKNGEVYGRNEFGIFNMKLVNGEWEKFTPGIDVIGYNNYVDDSIYQDLLKNLPEKIEEALEKNGGDMEDTQWGYKGEYAGRFFIEGFFADSKSYTIISP